MVELGDFIDKYRILNKVADSSVSSTYIAEQIPAGTSPVLLTLWHGVRLTASEDIQTFLKKARHGVLLTLIPTKRARGCEEGKKLG
jgi:hypothetical protein